MSAAQATSSDRLYYCTNTVTQTGGGVKPDAEEVERNPRARSAMLRGCEKLEAQA